MLKKINNCSFVNPLLINFKVNLHIIYLKLSANGQKYIIYCGNCQENMSCRLDNEKMLKSQVNFVFNTKKYKSIFTNKKHSL